MGYIIVNKTINLIGEDRNTTVIDWGGNEPAVTIISNWTNMTGFNVTRSSGLAGCGIELSGVHECNISENSIINKGGGINIKSSSSNHIIGNNITNSGEGIFLSSSSNNTITANNITNSNNVGIYLYHSPNNNFYKNNISQLAGFNLFLDLSSYNIFESNFISSDWRGMWILTSTNISVINNTFIGVGIQIDGDGIVDYNSHTIPDNNTINGKPVYYYRNTNNFTIDGIPVGELILANCTDVNIENLQLDYTDLGIEMAFCNNITIADNNINNTWMGIRITDSDSSNILNNDVSLNSAAGIKLARSDDNIIINNTITSNGQIGMDLRYVDRSLISLNNISLNGWRGFYLRSCWLNQINNNSFINNDYGLYLEGSNWNNITHNNVSDSDWDGITIDSSEGNTIRNNNISDNKMYGLNLDWSYSKIYHNNIIGNTNQAKASGINNEWDNGYPSGGNYWSDYGGVDEFNGPGQDIFGSDGIGDTPYTNISGSASDQDNYPLMNPYNHVQNHIHLKQGWNLISLPFVQDEQNLTNVLDTISGWYDSVQWYNPTDISDTWKHHKVGKPFGNDLSHLNESMGFWIHITKPGDTIFLYNGTQPTVNQSITLHPGWNMVGYPSLSNRNRDNALNNIIFGSDVDAIWTFDAATQTWQEIGPSDYFELGRGYWIHSKVTKVWDVPL